MIHPIRKRVLLFVNSGDTQGIIPISLTVLLCLGGGRVVRWCWENFQCRGAPANMDYSRARAYGACSRCGWGCLDIFSLIYHFSFLSPSLWETARYRLKYCLKGPLSPKRPTNQLLCLRQYLTELRHEKQST